MHQEFSKFSVIASSFQDGDKCYKRGWPNFTCFSERIPLQIYWPSKPLYQKLKNHPFSKGRYGPYIKRVRSFLAIFDHPLSPCTPNDAIVAK